MATLVLNPETLTTPQEAVSTASYTCATCLRVWDADEQTDMFELIDGKAYCTEGNGGYLCAARANAKAYRKHAAQLVNDKINEALEALADLQREYPNHIDDEGNPTEMLTDVRDRLRKFVDGKENGWRNGLMLGGDEVWMLRLSLRSLLGLGNACPMPDEDNVAISSSPHAARAIRRAVRNIEAYALRTQEGCR